MGLLDSLQFPPDEELRKFLEEFDATNGRMYQNDSRPVESTYGSSLPPVRPKYYGRKQTNSLRLKRNSRLITQGELAVRTGTTRRTIVAIENDRRKPSVYLAIAIAESLEMPVEALFHLSPLTPVKPSKY